MCLGIPGQIVTISADRDHVATAEVAGVRREVDVALLAEEQLGPGDWVLIHVGFAMAKIDEEEAERALAGFQLLAADDELEALRRPGDT